jgi:hypothetical protein
MKLKHHIGGVIVYSPGASGLLWHDSSLQHGATAPAIAAKKNVRIKIIGNLSSRHFDGDKWLLPGSRQLNAKEAVNLGDPSTRECRENLDKRPAFAAFAQDKVTQPLAPMARDVDPAFEVAVVKPADPNDRNQGFRLNGRRIFIENNTMTSIICFAYSIQKTQIVNAPQWFDEQPWDINGVPDTEGAPNWHQYRRMLQKLLSMRFGLVIHGDKRELSVYATENVCGVPTRQQPGMVFFCKQASRCHESRVGVFYLQSSAVSEVILNELGSSGRATADQSRQPRLVGTASVS